MFKKKFIVAGNYEEYRTFLHNHKDDINVIYVYVNSSRDLKGLRDIEGFYIGTYYKRHDIDTIKEVIRTSKNYSYKPAEDSVYGNVTAFKRDYKD
jgi:hypothetical protein